MTGQACFEAAEAAVTRDLSTVARPPRHDVRERRRERVTIPRSPSGVDAVNTSATSRPSRGMTSSASPQVTAS